MLTPEERKTASSFTILKSDIKDWIVRTAEKPYLSFLEKNLKGCKSVLDVGYGIHSPIAKIPRTFHLEGIDMLPPPKDKKFRVHDSYKKGDIRQIKKFYKPKSFDAAVILDVVEHLKKRDSLKLLEELETIVRKKIIVITPYGFMYQGAVDGNPYMRHLSGWWKKDFKKLGYSYHGMHGLKFLRGAEAGIKYKPWYFWLYVSHLTQFIAYFFPKIAFHIIAVKSLNERS